MTIDRAAILSAPADAETPRDDIVYPSTIPFLLEHLACFAVFWTGATLRDWIICAALYVLRMFAVTAGHHRYFSHRTFRTSRVGQFLLAVCCQTSVQRGILWWAAKHRAHHKYSDTVLDVHSPRLRGFWYAHFGWIFAEREGQADYSLVADFARFPEIVWIDRQRYLPGILLGFAVWLYAGWSGVVVGFLLSTVLVQHCTFMINSLAHVRGSQRYVTGDDSRNNWLLALLTGGEGWHNNHHHYQTSTRQGFYWWEIDLTYYALRLLAICGLVWDLRSPPAEVVAGERPLGAPVVDKSARRLVASLPIESIARQIREAWNHTPSLADLRKLTATKWSDAHAILAKVSMPALPSLEELRARARELFAHTRCLDRIAERARELLVEAVSAHLLAEPLTA
ncbi:MAG: acyl-CoA desaturase [Planctomycetes bacterium]|nr:acyl-CoA desaturase [Planctomycetota bacterium]